MTDNKIVIGSFVLFVGLMIGGCATVPHRPALTEKEIYLTDACEQNDITWHWDQVAQVVTLEYHGARAKVLIGSDLVMVGKDRVMLSAPAHIVQSAVVVPRDFQTKVVEHLRQLAIKKKERMLPKFRNVVIDAGHGGKDPGAIGRSGLQEKEVVLDICRRVAKHLRNSGLNVKLTRDTDEFIPLKTRTEMASQESADLFVSVHANSSPARGVFGIETYSAKDLGFIDRTEEQRQLNQRMLFKTLAIKDGSSDVEQIIADMLYDNKQYESEVLAKQIGQRMSKEIKTKNRGEKTARFFVLRNTLVPAVLVEVGFLSNPKEEKLLEKKSYREEIARSLAEGILSYAKEQ